MRLLTHFLPQVIKQIGFKSNDAAVKVEALAFLALLFAPLSQATTMFTIQNLPFALTPHSFTISLISLAFLYASAYWLLQRRSTPIRPLARRVSNSLLPVIDLALVRVRDAIRASVEKRKVVSELQGNPVSELQGSQPEGPTASDRPPAPRSQPRRAFTWPLRWKRNRSRPEEYELPVANV